MLNNFSVFFLNYEFYTLDTYLAVYKSNLFVELRHIQCLAYVSS